MTQRIAVHEFVQQLLSKKGDTDDFSDNTLLISSGRLESVDALAVVLFLEEKYGVDFAECGFDQNDLDSIDSIVTFLATN
jgi:acyl carrier protein